MNDKITRLIYLLAKACFLVEGMFDCYDLDLRYLTTAEPESDGLGIEELLINFAKGTIRKIKDELDDVINERENDDITYTCEKYLDERYAVVLTGLMGDLQEVLK